MEKGVLMKKELEEVEKQLEQARDERDSLERLYKKAQTRVEELERQRKKTQQILAAVIGDKPDSNSNTDTPPRPPPRTRSPRQRNISIQVQGSDTPPPPKPPGRPKPRLKPKFRPKAQKIPRYATSTMPASGASGSAEVPHHQSARRGSMPLPGEDSKRYTKEERMIRKKDLVFEEIKSSERSYVSSLLCVITYFLEPLRKKSIGLKTDEKANLFLNIEEITQFHKTLLSKMEKANANNIHENFRNTKFLKKMYSGYVDSYHKAIQVITTHEHSSKFQRHLNDSLKASGKQLGLMAYLIMPIQRIPRYVLLLRELLKNTVPEQKEDIKSLSSVIENVENLATEINERKRRVDDQLNLMAVRSKLGRSHHHLGFDLVHPKRRFILEGRLKEYKKNSKHTKERVVVLCSDLILWATYPHYKYKGYKSRKGMVIRRVNIKNPHKPGTYLDGVEVMTEGNDKESAVFFANTPQEAEAWYEKMKFAHKTTHRDTRRSSFSSAPPLPGISGHRENSHSPSPRAKVARNRNTNGNTFQPAPPPPPPCERQTIWV